MANYQQVIDAIKSGTTFLIASHAHPDGDGIGSTIALGKGLELMGKKVVMFNADKVPYNLQFLPYSNEVVDKLGDKTFDATFMVDCSQRDRISGDVAKAQKSSLGKIVLIDHHLFSAAESDVVCVDENAAATGEVVLKLFKLAGIKITPELATLLFCTFVVDSGSFRYSNTSAGLLRDAADLVEAGANPWAISQALDESNPPCVIKLLKLVLETFDMSDGIGWIVLSEQMLREANASVDVAEEFINYPRSIKGIEVAVLFRELKVGKWKISLRSKDKVDVYKIAAGFKGGGHSHAAGCTIEGDLASIKAMVLGEVRKHLPTN
jgi:phosphoesterase RecJ-like protein